MQVTVRLSDVMSKRLQKLLDRGLTKTHVLHEALDKYLPLDTEEQAREKAQSTTRPKLKPQRSRRRRWCRKAPHERPFGYAEPLPRTPSYRAEVSGSFNAYLGGFSPFRAALRSPFSAQSSFAESQSVHLSGRHQTVLSFGLTRCLAAVASWPITSFRVWFVRWLAQVILGRQRDAFACPKHLDSKQAVGILEVPSWSGYHERTYRPSNRKYSERATATNGGFFTSGQKVTTKKFKSQSLFHAFPLSSPYSQWQSNTAASTPQRLGLVVVLMQMKVRLPFW